VVRTSQRFVAERKQGSKCVKNVANVSAPMDSSACQTEVGLNPQCSSRVDSQRLGRSDLLLAIAHKSRSGAPPRFHGSERRRVFGTYGGSKPHASAEGIASHLATALPSTTKYRSLTLCVEDLRGSFELAGLARGDLNLRERGTRAFSTLYCSFPKYLNFSRVDHIAWVHDAASVPLRFKYPQYETEYKIDTGIHWINQRI